MNGQKARDKCHGYLPISSGPNATDIRIVPNAICLYHVAWARTPTGGILYGVPNRHEHVHLHILCVRTGLKVTTSPHSFSHRASKLSPSFRGIYHQCHLYFLCPKLKFSKNFCFASVGRGSTDFTCCWSCSVI